MKTVIFAASAVIYLTVASAAVAAPRTVTLEVENVSCVACAPIVEMALSHVAGVSKVEVVEDFGMALATVSFDDEKATVEMLTQATSNAGFPSAVKTGTGQMSSIQRSSPAASWFNWW